MSRGLEDRGECLAPFLVDRSMAWESEHCMTRCCVPHPTSRSSLHARASRLSTRPTSRRLAGGRGSFTVLNEFLLNARTSRRLTRDRGLTGYTAHIAPCTQIFTPHAQALDHCPPLLLKVAPLAPPRPLDSAQVVGRLVLCHISLFRLGDTAPFCKQVVRVFEPRLEGYAGCFLLGRVALPGDL